MAADGVRKCCNEQCIGGCFGPSSKECVACKQVLGIDGRCQTRCGPTYKVRWSLSQQSVLTYIGGSLSWQTLHALGIPSRGQELVHKQSQAK